MIERLVKIGMTPIQAKSYITKLAQVEELVHWARQIPNDLDDEGKQGWMSARTRILDIANKSQSPEDASESINNVIEITPSPQKERDRGRLRAFNEALDSIHKGGGVSETQSPDAAPESSNSRPEQELGNGDNTGGGGFAPGQNTSRPQNDIGMGTTRMSKAVGGIPETFNYETMEREPWIFDEPLGGHNKFLMDDQGQAYFWKVGSDLRPPHMAANKIISGKLGVKVISAGEINDVDMYSIEGSAGIPIFHFFDTDKEDEVYSLVKRAMPWADTIINYNKWVDMSEVKLAIETPSYNRRGVYDLMKYVQNSGENINWEEFKNTSTTPDRELDSILEIISEVGIAKNSDDNPTGGRFKISLEALKSILSPSDEDGKGRSRETTAEALRTAYKASTEQMDT